MKYIIALLIMFSFSALAGTLTIDGLSRDGVIDRTITLPSEEVWGRMCRPRGFALNHFRSRWGQTDKGTATDAAGNEFLVTMGSGNYTLHWVNGKSLCLAELGTLQDGVLTILQKH